MELQLEVASTKGRISLERLHNNAKVADWLDSRLIGGSNTSQDLDGCCLFQVFNATLILVPNVGFIR